MKNKLLSIAMVIALVLALYVPAGAAGDLVFTIVAPEGEIAEGESFKVTVEVSGNTGFNSFELFIPYDAETMTCTAARGGDAIKSMMYVTNPASEEGVIITGISTSANRENGELATMYFLAKTAITDPTFEFSRVACADIDGKAIDFGTAFRREAVEIAPAESEVANSGSDIGTGGYDIDTRDIMVTEAEETITFPDTSGHWGESYISRAAQLGLFKGSDDGKFYPDDDVTRAQFVTVLYRLAKSPAVTATTPFTDIDGQIDEFKAAIAWAYSNGYINGTTDTTFEPESSIKREEAMKILFYYAGGKTGGETELASEYDAAYPDSGDISDWGRGPMYWGVFNGLIRGSDDGKLSPQAEASRAALATILVNFLDKFAD